MQRHSNTRSNIEDMLPRAEHVWVSDVQVWGDGTGHDWPWWKRMAQEYL